MQYIGRIFSSAKRMYSDINSATLSGAIDVIVVKYPNGTFVSSPFYVQFGKTGVFRPCADEVEVTINGIPRTDLRMRVNRFGQAYFDDPDAVDDEGRCDSPNLDSGIQFDFQSGPSPSNSDTCHSPTLSDMIAKSQNPSSSSSDVAQDLLQSVHLLLQNSDFREFESNIQWWNQEYRTSPSMQIQTYQLTDEQQKAAETSPRSANNGVWAYWDHKWYSWRTANIKLRFLRNFDASPPPYFDELESKMMEVDRENPAFVLLPTSPPHSTEKEGTQFEVDHLESGEPTKKPPTLVLFKPSHDDGDDTSDNHRIDYESKHASSLPGSPPTSSDSPELAYFSDGHSPKDYEEEEEEDEMGRFNWRSHGQWERSGNSRAFKLSSEDIKRLNLDDGTNEAVFTTINKYQGTCTCYCLIYVWNHNDRVVVSDIDGTITKSDLLGHVLHWVGFEWTHLGVIQLYKKIAENGFRLMYLSARAIGQANPTRSFLEGLEQDNEKLPAGPIILSPNSLITTIQMEIIQKRPQVLKIANLKRLGQLFRQENPTAPCPFYAGFGNRVSDIETYRTIGIPDSRIFIVNPEGIIETPTGLKLFSGYTKLYEMADVIFPPENQKLPDSAKYSNFSFWRDDYANEIRL